MGLRIIEVSLYITILVTSKTFDTLDHNCLLRKLRQQPIIRSRHGHTSPITRHGVFTDWFIFEHIIEHFSRENGISAPFMSAFKAEDIKKGKLNVFKWSKVSF